MTNVLLLGAGGNAGINFTKCLRYDPKVRVFGADMNKYYLDTCNAHVKVHVDYEGGDYGKIESILEIVDRQKIDMIHAQPDPEVCFLLKNHFILKHKVFEHKHVIWEKFSNKMYCQERWSKEVMGIETYSYLNCCLDPKLFTKMAKAGGGKVWIRAMAGAGSKGALPVTSFSQAESWVSYWEQAKGMNASDFMLCEFLPGKEYAVQTFWYKGNLVHSQARERVVYFFGALMPSGQTSTPAVARTVHNKHVYTTAYKAIQTIDPQPHGIYCVDIKENSLGVPVPMEVNYGRFFTTSDFFASIGMNSPLEYVRSFTEPDYKPSYYMETIRDEYYWIRGLDKEPKLMMYE